MLDGGDALFPRTGERDPARAKLILEAMAATGLEAAAVGEGDLALGVDWLVKEAKAAGVPYLSSNLVDELGNAPFESRKVVDIAGSRVGIFSLLKAADPLIPEGYALLDPILTTRREATALREEGAELVIALVHGAPDLVNQIARSGHVDLILPAHARASTQPYRMGDCWVTYSGSEGKTILRLEVDLDGEGTLVSLANRRSIEERLEKAEGRLAHAKTEEEKEPLRRSVERFTKDLEVIGDPKGGRTFDTTLVVLKADVGEDEGFLEKVQKLEAKAAPKKADDAGSSAAQAE